MINIFKKKVELKNDKSLMHSHYEKKGLKLSSEIVVPDDFDCLIYHKGRLLTTVGSGSHKVDVVARQLIDKHPTTKRKLKYIKIIPHFVSKSPQQLDVKVKNNIYSFEFCVGNSALFAEYVLLYAYKVDHNYTLECVYNCLAELISYVHGQHNRIQPAHLSSLGIKIIEVNAKSNKKSIFNTFDGTISADKEMQTNKIAEVKPEAIITSNQNQLTAEPNQPMPKQENAAPACPKCGNVTKFQAAYCLKCGHKLQ